MAESLALEWPLQQVAGGRSPKCWENSGKNSGKNVFSIKWHIHHFWGTSFSGNENILQEFKNKTHQAKPRGNWMEVSVSSWGYPQLSSIDFPWGFSHGNKPTSDFSWAFAHYGVSPISKLHHSPLRKPTLADSVWALEVRRVDPNTFGILWIHGQIPGRCHGCHGCHGQVRDQYGHVWSHYDLEIPIMMGQIQVTSEFRCFF